MFPKINAILSNARTIKVLMSLIIIIIIVIATYQWLMHTPLAPLTQPNFSLSDWTVNVVEKISGQKEGRSNYLNTLILFVFLSLTTSIGLPRQIAAFVAGIHLGALNGVIIATLAATLGCLITFSISRYLLSDKITRKYPEKLAKLSKFLGEKTFLKALVIRILPLGSNFLTNIIAGVSKVSMLAYVSGSFVGFIPQMIIFSLAGSGIQLGSKNEVIVSLLLFIVAFILSVYLVKVHKIKNS